MKRVTMAMVRWILARWGLVVCTENELREARRDMERIARQWAKSGNANDGIKDNTRIVLNTKRRIVAAIESLGAARAGGELFARPVSHQRGILKRAAGVHPGYTGTGGEWWARDILGMYPLAALMSARDKDLEPHELEARRMHETHSRGERIARGLGSPEQAKDYEATGDVAARRELVAEAFGPGSRSMAIAKGRTPKRRRKPVAAGGA